MFLRKKQKIETLIMMPKDFDAWLENSNHRWLNIEPTSLLATALETRDKEAILAAYTCCKKLFRKAYGALRRGKYRQAAKYYVMAGFDRTYFENIKRWNLSSFEENLAREVYHRNYSKVGYTEAMKIMEMLPSKAACDDCGFKLVKSQTAQVKCPNCGLVQTYAKHERDRVMATLARSLFRDEYKHYRQTFIDPRAASLFMGTEEVRELMALVEVYL